MSFARCYSTRPFDSFEFVLYLIRHFRRRSRRCCRHHPILHGHISVAWRNLASQRISSTQRLLAANFSGSYILANRKQAWFYVVGILARCSKHHYALRLLIPVLGSGSLLKIRRCSKPKSGTPENLSRCWTVMLNLGLRMEFLQSDVFGTQLRCYEHWKHNGERRKQFSVPVSRAVRVSSRQSHLTRSVGWLSQKADFDISAAGSSNQRLNAGSQWTKHYLQTNRWESFLSRSLNMWRP